MIGGAEIAAKPLEPALYLVATPIGNLSDISLRALETMAAADILACEDTRVTRALLARYGIRRRTTAYHEHNAAAAGPQLIAALERGESVALVSDAGSPLISDPGFRLVEAVQAKGFKVAAVPGPSAVIAALGISGLPTDTFLFAGFLPVREGQRRSRLAALAAVPATLVFFEAPRRLAGSLAAMAEILGDRQAAICREITKLYEEVRRGSLSALSAHYRETGAPKGETVVCVAPPSPADTEAAIDVAALLSELSERMPASKAAGEAARRTGLPRGELYRRLLAAKPGPKDG